MPLWGVEDSGYTMDGISPVWGLVSPAYTDFPNISFVRQPALYLIGYSGPDGPSLTDQSNENMPGSDFPVAAMNTIWGSMGSVDSSWPFDVVGRSSIAVFKRWQTLAGSTTTAGSILNLIWTDLAASAAVGTKGVLGPVNRGTAGETVPVSVSPLVHRIKYHYLFGVPAFLLAAAVILGTAIVLVSAYMGHASIARIRMRLQQVSAGRILTTLLYPEHSTLGMSPDEWSVRSGSKQVNLGDTPVPVGAFKAEGVPAAQAATVENAHDKEQEKEKISLLSYPTTPREGV